MYDEDAGSVSAPGIEVPLHFVDDQPAGVSTQTLSQQLSVLIDENVSVTLRGVPVTYTVSEQSAPSEYDGVAVTASVSAPANVAVELPPQM